MAAADNDWRESQRNMESGQLQQHKLWRNMVHQKKYYLFSEEKKQQNQTLPRPHSFSFEAKVSLRKKTLKIDKKFKFLFFVIKAPA